MRQAEHELYTPVPRPHRWALPVAAGVTAVVLGLLLLLFAAGPKRRAVPTGGAEAARFSAASARQRDGEVLTVRRRSASRTASGSSNRSGSTASRSDWIPQGPKFTPLDPEGASQVSQIVQAMFRNNMRGVPPGVARIGHGTHLEGMKEGMRYEATALEQITVDVGPDGIASGSNWRVLTGGEWALVHHRALPAETELICRDGAVAIVEWPE